MSLYAKYLVCYDISSDKRRKKLSDFLKDLGLVPMQKSVFYGDLKSAESKALARMVREILQDEDKCFWFPCRLSAEDVRQCPGYEEWNYDEPDGHKVI